MKKKFIEMTPSEQRASLASRAGLFVRTQKAYRRDTFPSAGTVSSAPDANHS